MTLYDGITLLTDLKKKELPFASLLEVAGTFHVHFCRGVDHSRHFFFQLQVTRMVKSDASGKPLQDAPVEFVPEK